MIFYVYILECSDKTLYVGITNDLLKRLRKHNGEVKGGAKYTRSRRPVKIIYKEEFLTRSKALKRELEIKHLTRAEKIKLTS